MSKDALRTRLGLTRLGLVLALFVSASYSSLAADPADAATYRTRNFVVDAPTAEIAEQAGKTAEYYRKELAIKWTGREMRPWYKPCTLSVKVGQIGAGGATTFAFDRGEVFGWRMNVQGSLERVLDSVIPHEVSHTVLACHFRRPLPRWADEGAATLIEHESEQRRQRLLLEQVWQSSRRIPLRQLLAIKEYPRDMQDVLTLYAEGYSLADFLVEAGGRKRFLEFLETAHHRGWDHAIEHYYSLKGVSELEQRWNGWIMAGSPRLNLPPGAQLADNSNPGSGGGAAPVIRSQSPDPQRRPESRPQAGPEPRSFAGNDRRGAAPILELPPPVVPSRELPAGPPPGADVADAGTPGWRPADNDGWVPSGRNGVRENDIAARTAPPFTADEGRPRDGFAPADSARDSTRDGFGPRDFDGFAPKDIAVPGDGWPAANASGFGPSAGTVPDGMLPDGMVSGEGRTPDWSGFPQPRAGHDPGGHSRAFMSPSSP